MIIIPAVDIKDGKCVRLLQGRMEDETVFSDDPAAMAQRWASAGAELIHVVDLDGAFEKRPRNLDAVKNIIDTVDIPIQLGGGIRNEHTVDTVLELGVQRVIIGTEAIRNPRWVKQVARRYPDQFVIGIDARDGRVAIEGWTETTPTLAVDLARQFEDCGVASINFTDIHRDGMQTGPNITETGRLAEAVDIPVVASGCVATIDAWINLLPRSEGGVRGVSGGQGLDGGTLGVSQARALVQSTT